MSDMPPEKSSLKRNREEEDSVSKRRKAALDAEEEIARIQKDGGPWPQFDDSLFKSFPKLGKKIEAVSEDIYETVQLYKADKELFHFSFGADPSAENYDEDAWDAIRYYQKAQAYAPKFRKPIPRKRTKDKPKRVTKEQAKEPTREQLEDVMNFDFPTSEKSGGQSTMVGSWPPSVSISSQAAKDSSYDLQLLNLISQAFLNKISSAEVEAMALDDRVVVSANEAASVKSLQETALEELIAKPPAELEDLAKEKHRDLSALRSGVREGPSEDGEELLVGIAVGASMFPGQRDAIMSSLKLLIQDKIKPAGPVNASAPGDALTKSENKARLVIVNRVPSSHAEQNLVLALLKSGYGRSKSVAVAGGKRPCTICYLSLCLVREEFTGLSFNPHAGGYYIGETLGGLTKIVNAIGLTEEQVRERAKHYLGGDFTSYITAVAKYDQVSAQERTALGVTDDEIRRSSMLSLPKLEGQGLLTRTSTVAFKPGEQFSMESFGEYDPSKKVEHMEVDEED
ncbi:MAG TPA: hypothetical protein VN695_14265 [Streptosporangiaceae bacterium]|nr:hypothetical protein [Streptosporangiaceae bacterium]